MFGSHRKVNYHVHGVPKVWDQSMTTSNITHYHPDPHSLVPLRGRSVNNAMNFLPMKNMELAVCVLAASRKYPLKNQHKNQANQNHCMEGYFHIHLVFYLHMHNANLQGALRMQQSVVKDTVKYATMLTMDNFNSKKLIVENSR